MSSLVRRISQKIDFFIDTRTPLTADDTRPPSGIAERAVDDLIHLKVAVTHANVVSSFFHNVAHIMTNFKPVWLS